MRETHLWDELPEIDFTTSGISECRMWLGIKSGQ